MKMNSVYLLFVLLCLPLCLTQDVIDDIVAQQCSDKSLLNGNELIYKTTDWDRAYNDVASCATLTTENSDYFCCYMKIKFKNEVFDEKFTQRGCIPVSYVYLFNDDKDIFRSFLDDKESNISKASNVTVKSLDIDCSAKFINIFTLSLLLFLL